MVPITSPNDHPFKFIKLKKQKIIFDTFKVNKLKWTDLERTQDWPKTYIASSSFKICKTSYFLKYIKYKSPLFNKKTADISSSMHYKITKIEDFDINNSYDIELANFILNNYDTIDHYHKYLISKDDLEAGSYLGSYPSKVIGGLGHLRNTVGTR